mgnify:CR=1 FL=1
MKNFITLLLSVIILFATSNRWCASYGKLELFTDLEQNTPVTLQYQKKANSKLITLRAKTSSTGRLKFVLKGKTISKLYITHPQNLHIKKSIYNRQAITLNTQNEYTGTILKNKIHITDLYNLIVLFCLAYYVLWLIINPAGRELLAESRSPAKMQNMEFLRIVFTFVILFFHIKDNFHYFSLGRYGVEFFFILSGFFFTLTYDRATDIIDFIKKKFIRFMPTIFFCSIVCGIFKKNINFSTMSSDWFFWTNTGLYGNSYVGSTWYISILFWVTAFYFYLLKTQRRETVNATIALLTFLAYAACVRFGWSRLDGLGDKSNIGYMLTQSLMRGVGSIGLGFFIAQLYLNSASQKSLFTPWQYTMIEAVVLCLPCVCMFYKPLFPNNVMLLVVCFAILIYLFASQKGYISQFLEKCPFSKISKYTLAIYISHLCIAKPLLVYLKMPPQAFHFASLGIVTYIATFCIVGVLIHHLVEVPGTKMCKKWLK